jgi:homocysteine S-methyltransferase
MTLFPEQKSDVFYITEGGTETEIMYKFGHELPPFAMYPLLDSPKAVRDLELMFQNTLIR